MLRVTVEEFPHGTVSQGRIVGTAFICNLRKHPKGSDIGSFHGYFETPDAIGRGRNVYVEDFPRGAPWELVAELIRAAYPADVPTTVGG